MQALRSLLLVLALGLPGIAEGQVTAVINSPEKAQPGDLVVLDASASAGIAFRWVLTNSSKTFLPIENGKRVVFASGTPAEYKFVLVVAGAGPNNSLEVATRLFTVTIGTPVPPEPPRPPDPPQPPTPPPVVEGKRTVILLRETADATPDMARLVNLLRNGPTADYLKQKGHRLFIVDQNAKDSTGQPLSHLVKEVREEAPKGLPRLVILDQVSSAVLYSESFDGTADTVAELTKRHGG